MKPPLPSLSWIRVVLAAATACWIVAVCASVASADAPRDERLRQRLSGGVLRWGGDAEGGAPFQFYDPATQGLIGFEVELVDGLVAELRRQLSLPELKSEYVQYKWVSLPQGLDKKDFDIIVSGLEITAENRKAMIFSRPYYIYSQQLTVRADETEIRSVEDCKNRPIATLSGSAADRFLNKLGATKVSAFEGQIEPYQELALRRVDAVLLDLPIAVYNAGNDKRFKFVGDRVGAGYYGVGLRSNDDDLAAALDEALGEMMRTGRIREIYAKWNLWNVDQFELASTDRPAEAAGLRNKTDGETEPPNKAAAVQNWTFSAYAPLLLESAGITVLLTCLSMAVAMVIGLVVAVCRLYGPAPVRALALAYVEFFRGTPLLLLLTFLYFGWAHVPYVGVDLSPWQAAIIGFGLNYAAFEAEIYRSSIMAVPKGQWEAAHALGMSDVTAFRRVIFPQAFRTALGPMTNDFVAMFKDTSLVSVIAIVELTQRYQILARSSLKFVEIGALTALLYLAMSVPLGYLARYLEDKWSTGHK
ncbi:MAG: ABC transporter substrate-binding protein/permease [Pirellulales bacterium]